MPIRSVWRSWRSGFISLRDTRKHRITPDTLAEFHEGLKKQLASLENQGGGIAKPRAAEEKARAAIRGGRGPAEQGPHTAPPSSRKPPCATNRRR